MNLDGLSMAALVAELNARLTGARVSKIFQPDKYTAVFWLRQPGEDIPLLLSANPEYPRCHLPSVIPENPPVPPVFCMVLRKHLEDGRVAKVEQYGLDRIISLHIDVRGERGLIVTKQVVAELMGKHSNLILLQDGVVIDAARRIGLSISRHRQVLPGREYLAPPGSERIDLLQSSPVTFVDTIRQDHTDSSLAKAIVAAGMGLGPVTAREMIWRAGLPIDIPVASLDDADAAALAEAVEGIITPLAESNIQPSAAVATDGSRILGMAAFRLEHLAKHDNTTFATMSDLVEFGLNFKGKPQSADKTLLQKLVAGEAARLRRKESAITDELATAQGADTIREYADILMASLHELKQGLTEIVLPNLYATDPAVESVKIPLSPELGGLENAQRYYNKYNKLKRAQESLAHQLSECRSDINYIDSIAVAVDMAINQEDLKEIRSELIAAGYLSDKTKRRPEPPAAPLGAAATDGTAIFIGKNNRQNDQVTFKLAHPDDIWLHTKDIPGSHVILRVAGKEASPSALTEAAMLAAFFSKARQSANVPVDYTRRRFVKKPAGAKPGFVIYEHQKTVYVTPDEALVNTLLKNKKGES